MQNTESLEGNEIVKDKKLRFRQVHLDFHTSEKIDGVGDLFNPEEFVDTLLKAKVNSITCFARCHHGMIYYDTKFDTKHPGLKRNLLKEQIDICHKNNINVSIYISVGWDEYMAYNHPEWLERASSGKPFNITDEHPGIFEAIDIGWKKLCLNSSYRDYVIEQTEEVLELFKGKIDGLFFDIVFQNPCACKYCIEDMKKKGMEPSILENRKRFSSEVLVNFKKEMTETIRKYEKDCTIFYNSGDIDPYIRKNLKDYTHLEIESLPSGIWGYDHFPITVSYAKNLCKEYIAMTGRFHKMWGDFGGYKNKEALEYECFTGLANGAKCSIGDQLHPSGKIDKATYKLIGSVYKSVQKKEQWCNNVIPVADIGIYNPAEFIEKSGYEPDAISKGVYHIMAESHQQFSIIDRYVDFSGFKLIILPDSITLDEELKNKLEDYLRGGGRLLLSHESGMDSNKEKFVLNDIGIEYISEAGYSPDYIKVGNLVGKGLLETEYVLYDKGLWVEPSNGTEVLANIWNPYFNRSYKEFCSHFHTPVEKDSGYSAITKNENIIYFSHPIFSMYGKHGQKAYKELVLNSIDLLLKNKSVITNAPTTAHINLNFQDENNRYILHINHYIPENRCSNIATIEDIIPLYDISLKVKLPQKPKKVYLAPTKEELDFSYEEGYCNTNVPRVYGHEMVIFEL